MPDSQMTPAVETPRITDATDAACRSFAEMLIEQGDVSDEMSDEAIIDVILAEIRECGYSPKAFVEAVLVAMYVEEMLANPQPRCRECEDTGLVEWFHGDREMSRVCTCSKGRELDDERAESEVW